MLWVAGGGTGGHVSAGLALLQERLKKTGSPSPAVLYVGARGGMEEKMVPRLGIPLELLRMGALNRVSLKNRIRTLAQFPRAIAKTIRLLLTFRPAYVVGVGGYASGPVLALASVIGKLWGCRTGILEQNSVPGMTNRILATFVDEVFCAFPGSEGGFPGRVPGTDIHIVGNPIRGEFEPLALPLEDTDLRIFVFGGSQGAVGLNSLVLAVVEKLSAEPEVARHVHWVHQTGERDLERVRTAHERFGSLAEVVPFIHDMKSRFGACHLVVARSGSSTLSELAAVRRPCFLVPLPTAANDHQAENAKLFAKSGMARVLEQNNPESVDQLASALKGWVLDPARRNQDLKQMAHSAEGFYRPHAAEELLSILLKSSVATSAATR